MVVPSSHKMAIPFSRVLLCDHERGGILSVEHRSSNKSLPASPTATLELPFPKGDLDDEDGEPFPKGFFTFPFAGVLFMACIAFPMATLSTESNLCQNGLQINIYYFF